MPKILARQVLTFVLMLVSAFAATAQPAFMKIFVPDTIGPGSVSTLTFRIENSSASPVTNLAFTDTLPAGVTIADPATTFSDCSDFALNATDGSSMIILSGGRLAPNTSCVITVDVTSNVPGMHLNTTSALTSSAGNSSAASATLTVSTDRPGFLKSFAPNTILLGGTSTLTFTIDNSANLSTEITDFSFSDNLPAGVIIADPANVSNTCENPDFTGGTVTAAPGTGTVSLTSDVSSSAAVDAESSCAISVDVVGNTVGEKINSSGELTWDGEAAPMTSGKANARLTVTGQTLQFTKSFLNDPVAAGATVDLQFTITNMDRNNSATGISFSDDLDTTLSGLAPDGALPTDPCGTGSTLTFSSGTLSLSSGNITADGACSFSVTLAVPPEAATANYSNTTSLLMASIPGSPFAAASDVLVVAPLPHIEKNFTIDPVAAGDTATLQFTITNTSAVGTPSSVTYDNVTFDDPLTFLPTPVSVSLSAGSDPPCGVGSSLAISSTGFTLMNGTIDAGSSCTFSVDIGIPASLQGNIYTNTSGAVSARISEETTLTGNQASDTLTVVKAPQLEKEFIDDPIVPGGSGTLQFTLTHDALAPSDATDISFTDDLAAIAAGITAAGLPQSDLCGPGNGTLTASAGDTMLNVSGITLAPGQVCTFQVTITVAAGTTTGVYSNTTSNVSATVSGLATQNSPAQSNLIVSGLLFKKEFLDDPVLPGGTTRLRFTFDNSFGDEVMGISVDDNLDNVLSGLKSLMLIPSDPCGSGWTISETETSTITFSGGNIPAGTACIFDFLVQVPADVAEENYLNRTSSLTISTPSFTLPAATDNLTVSSTRLALTKTFTGDPVLPGNSVTLQFTLSNLDSAQSVSSIAFTDDLGATLTNLAPSTSLPIAACNGMLDYVGTELQLAGASLAPGGSCTFSVVLTVPADALGGLYGNTTSAVSGQIDGLPVSGVAASDTLTVIGLVLSKTFASAGIAGGNVTLMFTMNNLGSQALADLRFTDDLNAVISGLIATGLPLSNACGAGSSISGSSTLSLDGGNLAAGGTCNFTVNLQIPTGIAAGNYLNTTSAVTERGSAAGNAANAMLHIDPPPTFSKIFMPDLIAVGATSTLNFTIDNTASTQNALNLAFTDNFPAGLTVANPANATTTCSGGTLTAVPGAAVLSLSGATVNAASSCEVSVAVTGVTAGMYINNAGELTSSSGNSGTASDTLTIAPPPRFSKTFSPNPIFSGLTSTLTFAIDNSASGLGASNLTFMDSFPAGISVHSPANATNTCGGAWNAATGVSAVSLSGGNVNAGAVCSLSVDVVTANTSGNLTNVTGNLFSSGGDSGTASANLIVNPPPSFSKNFAPASIAAGSTSSLNFTINNSNSSLNVTNLSFSDNFPAGLIIASPADATNSCGGNWNTVAGASMVSLSGAGVSAGATCMLSVQVTADTTANLLNTTGVLTSSAGTSGTASANLSINPPPAFSKSFAPVPISAGAKSTLTFTIDNTASTLNVSDLAFSDTFPSGLTVANPPNTTNTCPGGTLNASAGGTLVSFSGASLNSGASCTFSVEVTANSPAILTNTTDDLTSSTGNSGRATAILTVTPPPPPKLALDFDPNPVSQSNPSTMTILIDNGMSMTDATGLGMTFELPNGLTVATGSTGGTTSGGVTRAHVATKLQALANASTSCTGGTLTAIDGASTISYSGGAVGAGATCTIAIDVAAAQTGSYAVTTGQLTSSNGNSASVSNVLTVISLSAPLDTVPTLDTRGLILLVLMLALYGIHWLRLARNQSEH